MRKVVLLALMLVPALWAWAQNEFEHDAVLVENRATSFVVRSSGIAADKKQAAEQAAMSAVDTYLFRGIEGVGGGKPLLAENAAQLKPDYFKRLYADGRYMVFVRGSVEQEKPKKQPDGRFRAVMLVEINYKALLRDVDTNKLPVYGSEPVAEPASVDIAEVALPKVVVLPDARRTGGYAAAMAADENLLMAVRSLNVQLAKRGVEVVDFKGAYDSYMAANPGADAAGAESAVLGACGAKAVVLVEARRNRQSGGNGVSLSLKAVESGSNALLAAEKTSIRPIKTDDMEKLYDFASVRVLSKFIPAMKTTLAARYADTPKPAAKAAPVQEENLDPIDVNLPKATAVSENTFAVIIGNEDYKYVAKVPFAVNDASIFAKYCRVTLGLPDDNVRLYKNATYGDMLDAIDDISAISEVYGGKIRVIFYYAGHGVPDEASRNAYLLPVDARSQQLKTCYAIEQLYSRLSALKAESVTVLLDACFSGSLRGDGMLMSARGVAIKPRADEPKGSMVVFTAATGDQTAYPYAEKRHGMFTYYLLSKLQESGGAVTLGELGDYITAKVSQQSVKVNRKAQSPTISVSPDIEASWRTLPLR
ncbi:MAG: DUF6175 family protein [Muribaculaceae bacterium]